MKDYFKKLSDILFNILNNNEILILNLDAEKTDFVRFNQAKIRQAGNVNQVTLTMNLIIKNKTLTSIMRLNANLERDTKVLLRTLDFLRREIPELHEDPYLMYERNINSSEIGNSQVNIDSKEIADNIISSVEAMDMVGILASGSIVKGFSNSLGQFNWHESQSFNFDWSIYTKSGKAIKQNYSNHSWNNNTFKSLVNECKQKLDVIDNKEEIIKPGSYKVYLSPSALNDIIEMMSWGGFSYKANKIGTSPLHLMSKGEKVLNKMVSFSENLSNGISPKFHSDGFIKPNVTELITNGKYIMLLNIMSHQFP